jgi:hypothetical protein
MVLGKAERKSFPWLATSKNHSESFDRAQDERKKSEMLEKNPCMLSLSKQSGGLFRQRLEKNNIIRQEGENEFPLDQRVIGALI